MAFAPFPEVAGQLPVTRYKVKVEQPAETFGASTELPETAGVALEGGARGDAVSIFGYPARVLSTISFAPRTTNNARPLAIFTAGAGRDRGRFFRSESASRYTSSNHKRAIQNLATGPPKVSDPTRGQVKKNKSRNEEVENPRE